MLKNQECNLEFGTYMIGTILVNISISFGHRLCYFLEDWSDTGTFAIIVLNVNSLKV
jgi:hypothetical protein